MRVLTSTSRNAAALPQSIREGRHFRRDIQGLRAIAVIAVVFDHLVAWPRGGFIGVDVFFVISGFLITGLLLREYETKGGSSLVDFYRRRIRRIAPAAVLVLVVTTAASAVLLNAGRTQQIFWDAAWSFFLMGNWRFAASGTDYFLATEAVSPLQHFWSLAVEEQFYLIWPALIFGVYLLTAAASRRVARDFRRMLGLAMIVVVVLSFAWAYWESSASPTWAYFSTFSRAWELGAGALLAVLAPVLLRIPSAARPVIAWAGVVGIVVSLIVVNETSAFPAPWALLPVVSTALVIAAGTGGGQRFLAPLTNPVTQYVGATSYSLYLWHFPVIIFLEALLPERGVAFFAIAVFTMAFLAVMSYELVETTVRHSHWLEPRKKNSGSARRAPRQNLGRAQWVALIGTAVLVAVVSVIALASTRPSDASSAPLSSSTSDATEPPIELSPFDAEILRSATMSEWPTMTPAIADLGASQAPEWRVDGCIDVDDSNVADCVYGSGDKLAVLLGDSVAISYMPAIRAALEGDGWRIQSLTKTQCPAIYIAVAKSTGDQVTDTACNDHHQWVMNKLIELQPDLVIASSAEDSLRHLDSGLTQEAAFAEWMRATDATLSTVSLLTPRTVLLAPPPQGEPITRCATQLNKPSDCNTRVGAGIRASMQEAEIDAALRHNQAGHEVRHVNTTSWFCTADGTCPPLFGTIPIRVDANHLTAAFSSSLAPQMKLALL